jgi:hypothetical protein
VDELERRQRSSHQDAAEASHALEQLERRVFAGEEVTDAQRKRAEDALAKAREAGREPWGERVRAAQQAVRDAGQVVRAFVAESLDALLVELTEDAERAAANVNERARATSWSPSMSVEPPSNAPWDCAHLSCPCNRTAFPPLAVTQRGSRSPGSSRRAASWPPFSVSPIRCRRE